MFGYVQVAPWTDTLLSLAWGNVLAEGRIPELSGPLVPVPHPLAILLAAPLSLLGPDGALAALGVICGLGILLLAYAVARLTRVLAAGRAPGPLVLAASLLAALLLLTRPRVEYYLLTGVIDVPFAGLVLLAIAQIAERPDRDPRRPLLLLGAAGLLRPEAWLLGIPYVVWLAAIGLRGRPLLPVAALALTPPLLWAFFDLIVTGDALRSLNVRPNFSTVGFNLQSFLLLDFGARWLPDREPIDNALLDVPGFAGSALTLVGIVGVAWGLRMWRRPFGPSGNPPAPAIVAAAVAVLAATLVAESLIGLRLVDRYSLPLVAAGISFATALLVSLRWRRAAVGTLALVALVAAVWAENPTQDSKYGYYLELASRIRSDQRDFAALADDPRAEAAIERCPRVIVGGRDLRKVSEAWAIVALYLDRDVAQVEVSRIPRGGPETSTFRFLSPTRPQPYLLRGKWLLRSACLRGPGTAAGEPRSTGRGKPGRR